ncbi:MAG TPA: hypothetical protein VJU59_25100 [Paraburkholderia sp.]|uniref:hypothetical protein n=1 Tax=Paraburkholderia sp. TaxID=1926495 RepID=UPI002B477E4A|nr:hypothetical protein [Paraburkholderia sp.]HKR42917.1 hypothetical protein [Paraburkholderia sp.]
MQAQKRFAQLVMPFAVVLSGLIAQAAAAESLESQSHPVAVNAGETSAALVGATTATQAAADSSRPVTQTAPATSATDTQSAHDASFGVALNSERLDGLRGGDALVGQNFLNGTVADNVANRVVTGSNAISDGSFSNSSGLPTVIQNTGSNVLIQNATVLNVRFGN